MPRRRLDAKKRPGEDEVMLTEKEIDACMNLDYYT